MSGPTKQELKEQAKAEIKEGANRAQPAVHDEWWPDERVRSYLDLPPQEGVGPDYHVLLKAYRGMVPETFERFIGFFKDAGRNLNEAGPDGRSILQLISTHRRAGEYAEILRKAGAH